MGMRIISLLIGYGCGLFQTSYIYGRMQGIDIREKGSGNAGTTNALRTLGKKAGIIVMVGDIVKCILAAVIVWLLFGRNHPELDYLLRTWAGFGCIMGHNYPFYMGFRGGKGVACTAGFINTISWQMTIIGNILFFSNLFITHYVSLGSLMVGVMLLIGTIIMGQLGMFHLSGPAQLEMYVVVAVITLQIFIRHRENIKRLLNGTERKTYLSGKGKRS